MGLAFVLMPVIIGLIVVGIALGVIGFILYITGLRNNARNTMWYGCWLIAGSFLCFYFIYAIGNSSVAID